MTLAEQLIDELVESNCLDEELKLSPKDKKVIMAFHDKKAGESKKLSTDGKQLDIMGMGGNKVAFWKDGKIHSGDDSSRARQTIMKFMRRNLPKNDFAE